MSFSTGKAVKSSVKGRKASGLRTQLPKKGWFPIEMTMKQVFGPRKNHWDDHMWIWIIWISLNASDRSNVLNLDFVLMFWWIFIQMLKEVQINNLNNPFQDRAIWPSAVYGEPVIPCPTWRFPWGYLFHIQVVDDCLSIQATMVTWGSLKSSEHPYIYIYTLYMYIHIYTYIYIYVCVYIYIYI